MKRLNSGITLIEALLVIAIGSVILYMSIQQYLTYRRGADAYQVQANVNTVFQALAAFYRVNCYGTTDGNGVMVPASMNPANLAPPGSIFPVNITTDLINKGFLTTPMPINPIVDPAGAGTGGYVAQFNMTDPAPEREVCMAGTDTTGPFDPNCTSTSNVGTIITWKAQVAVQLKDTASAREYMNLMAGDCLSTLSGATVVPCSSSGNTGTFVVWERLPSMANINVVSDYWPTMPTVSQFTQMYTSSPITSLTDGSQTANQYYLCGS